MICKRAIIICSGASIRENQWDIPIKDLQIWKEIQDEYTIGINWLKNYYTPTVLLYGDYQFYLEEIENLKTMPLVFGMQDSFYGRYYPKTKNWYDQYHLHDNIYLLPHRKIINGKHYHGINAWKNGFYERYLTGIVAINLAIASGCKEIYILGMDCCSTQGRTHFYQDEFIPYRISENGVKNTGVGQYENGEYKTGVYNNSDLNTVYLPFLEEKDINIYNVSLNSKITVFPKISYKEFYAKIKENKEELSQDYLRYKLKEKYYEAYYN